MRKYLSIFAAGIIVAIAGIIVYKLVFDKSPEHKFGLERAAVVRQVQSLNRLETASFTIDKIIEAGTNYDKIREFLFGDQLLLVAHGQIIAGFDLTELTDESFEGSGDQIKITLPAAKILVSSLDNAQTKVFDRNRGLLTKGDLNLEAEARQQAEAAIRLAACEENILDTASKNARDQLDIIFKAAGFTNVTIDIIQSTECK